MRREARPNEAPVARLGDHAAVRGDTHPPQEGGNRPNRQFDIVIGAPGYEIVAAVGGAIPLGIAPHQHDVSIAADGKGTFHVGDTK